MDGRSPGPWARVVATFAEARRGLGAVLTLRPYDTSTSEGRAQERYRRAALSTATAALGHGLGIFTGLVNVRVTLGYLGKERYGLWMAISSLLLWVQLADFGLGRGLQNHLAEAHGRDDREGAARAFSTGFFALLAVAVAMFIAFVPALFLVPWNRVLAVSNPSLASETRVAVGAVAAVFLAQFPLSLVPTLYSAHQRGYVANLFNIGSSVVSLVTLLVVVKLKLSLGYLILAVGGVGVASNLVNLAYILHDMPWLRPRLSLVSRRVAKALASTSSAMMLFQLAGLLINEAQVLIVAHRIDLLAVTDWSILMRVYALPITFIAMLDGPMVPAFREAYVRGDRSWLRSAFFRLVRLKMGLALAGVLLYVVFGDLIAALFAGRAVQLAASVWWSTGLLLFVGVWNGSFNDLLIATDRLWVLVAAVAANALVTIVLTITMARSFGLVGVLLATVAFSLFVTAWLNPLLCRMALRVTPRDEKPADADPT